MIKLTDRNGNTIVERVNGEETVSDFSRVKSITALIDKNIIFSKRVDFTNLTSISVVSGNSDLRTTSKTPALYKALYGCPLLTEVSFPKLTSVSASSGSAGSAGSTPTKGDGESGGNGGSSYGGFYQAFYNCKNLESVSFDLLSNVACSNGNYGGTGGDGGTNASHFSEWGTDGGDGGDGGDSYGGFHQAFYNCTSLQVVNFPALKTMDYGNGSYGGTGGRSRKGVAVGAIGNGGNGGEGGGGGDSYGGFYQAFYNCTSLQEVNFPALTSISSGNGGNGGKGGVGTSGFGGIGGGGGSSYGGFYQAFYNCTSLQEVNFPSLTSISVGNGGRSGDGGDSASGYGSYPRLSGYSYGGFYKAFYNCTSLQEVNFPSLTSISVGSAGAVGSMGSGPKGTIGSASNSKGSVYKPFQDAFKGCPNVVVHFKSSMKGNSYLTVSNLGLSNSDQLKFDL